MRFEIQTETILRLLHADGTRGDIVNVSRIESFEGKPKEFRDHFGMLGYEVDCRIENEFDKAFPPKPETKPTPVIAPITDDEIPF